MPDAAAFAAALRRALPAGLSLGQADPARLHPLAAGEALPGAVPARLAEFSAGRAAARAALMRPEQSIPIGQDRAPVWPQGSVGSITHCAGLCLAVVGRDGDYRALGLDAEPMIALEADLWPTILRPDEMAGAGQPMDGLTALTHFVAKEAVYKAQYTLTKHLFGFHVLRLDLAEDRFDATFTQDIPPFARGHALSGQILRAGGYLGALVALGRF